MLATTHSPARPHRTEGRGPAFTLAVLLAASNVSASVGARPTEYQVKAAYLYNFARFVEWPPGTFASGGQPFVIAIVGQDPFGAAPESTLQGKNLDGRPLLLRRGGPEAAPGAHLVFVCGSEARRLEQIVARVGGRGVLTVGDEPAFARRGTVIAFRVEGSHVRFDINLRAAEQAGLKLSSQLLRLAHIVGGSPAR